MNQPELIVMVGLPGSGKSTFVKQLLEDMKDAFVYSTDMYIELEAVYRGDTYNNIFKECISQATKECNRLVAEAFSEGKDIIWDQTNLGAKKRKRILSQTPKEHNYRCMCILFEPPKLTLGKRALVHSNVKRKDKFISAELLNRMNENYEEPMIAEGFNSILKIKAWYNE